MNKANAMEAATALLSNVVHFKLLLALDLMGRPVRCTSVFISGPVFAKGEKKSRRDETPKKAFNHVGLLFNWLPGKAGLPFI